MTAYTIEVLAICVAVSCTVYLLLEALIARDGEE